MKDDLVRVKQRVAQIVLASYRYCFRRRIAEAAAKKRELKIYYGCGHIRQPDYLNVDIRYTAAVDLVASLEWCSGSFQNRCDEVFVSHVLEHYEYPGKEMRNHSASVLGALAAIYKMLRKGGKIRIGVPDFSALVYLYSEKNYPLYPRLVGRLMGEQNYPQNRHLCLFDLAYLADCLEDCGFTDISRWDPLGSGLVRDSCFDEIDGHATSLNVLATKA